VLRVIELGLRLAYMFQCFNERLPGYLFWQSTIGE